MTGQVPAKIRFVKCPKCLHVLSEPSNVRVYQCGGCNTVLQAKKRQVTSEEVETPVNETVTVHKNEPENIRSHTAAQNFSQEEILPLTGHRTKETSCESNQTEIQISSGEHPLDAESSPEISNKLSTLGNEKSTPDVVKDEYVSRDSESAGFSEECMHCGNVESSPETDKGKNACKDAESSTGFPEELVRHGSLLSNPGVGIDECVSEDAESATGFSEELIRHGNVETTQEIDQDGYLSKPIDRGDEKKPHRRVIFSGEFVYSADLNHLEHEEYENETSLGLTNETNQRESLTVVETNVESNESFRSHAISGSLPEDEFFDESILNNDHLSPLSEELEQSLDRASFCYHECMSSIDTLGNSVALRDMPESPMTRSHYGFYGSGSSCDGTDDQIIDRKFYLSKRNFGERELTNGKSLVRNGGASNKIRGNLQGQNRYFSSSSSGERRSSYVGLPLYETKIDTNEHQPRLPFYPCDQGVGYSNGNYSNYEMNMNLHVPNKRGYLEVEKMELLKKVSELEDQLKGTYISGGKQNGNFHRPAESQVHRPPRIPFSLETTKSRNEVDHTCLQCPNHPHGDIPLHSFEANSDASSTHTNHSDAIKARAERLYLGKRHTLPVVSGAPFLLCYGCSVVLQMPADFLLFKRRYHKLKCGSCSMILKFSVRNRTHLVKYIDHRAKYLSPIDPVSIDDIGPSFCQSFSAEEAAAPKEPQFDDPKRTFVEKKMSNSKKGNKFTKFVKTIGSIRSSSKRLKAESSTSESEEVQASANSPLHRLMGYHSATILLEAEAEF